MQREEKQLKYITLANMLREQIQSGKIMPGALLQSENELSKAYGISRISVRKSLDQLVEEGLVIKKAGIGTEVAPSKRRSLRIASTMRYSIHDHGIAFAVEQFERDYPDVEIKFLTIPMEQLWETVDYLAELDAAPDLLLLTDTQVHMIANWQDYRHLDAHCQSNEALLYSKLLPHFTVSGHVKAVPITFSPVFLVYHPELFQARNIPEPTENWSTADFMTAVSKLTVNDNNDGTTDQYGLSLSPNFTRWPIIGLQNGVDFSTIRKNPYQLREPLQLIRNQLYRERNAVLETNINGMIYQPFFEKKAAMMMTTTMKMAAWRNSIAYESRLAPLVFGPRRFTFMIANALMIPERCQEPELAEAFLALTLRPDLQKRMTETYKLLSIYPIINETVFESSTLRRMNVEDETLKNAYFFYDVFPSAADQLWLEKHLAAFWYGLDSVEDVLQRMLNSDDV